MDETEPGVLDWLYWAAHVKKNKKTKHICLILVR